MDNQSAIKAAVSQANHYTDRAVARYLQHQDRRGWLLVVGWLSLLTMLNTVMWLAM